VSLRSKLIRLAHANPDLRPEIVPLLVEGAWDRSPEGFASRTEAVQEAAASLEKSLRNKGWKPVGGWKIKDKGIRVERHKTFANKIAEMAIIVTSTGKTKDHKLSIWGSFSFDGQRSMGSSGQRGVSASKQFKIENWPKAVASFMRALSKADLEGGREATIAWVEKEKIEKPKREEKARIQKEKDEARAKRRQQMIDDEARRPHWGEQGYLPPGPYSTY